MMERKLGKYTIVKYVALWGQTIYQKLEALRKSCMQIQAGAFRHVQTRSFLQNYYLTLEFFLFRVITALKGKSIKIVETRVLK